MSYWTFVRHHLLQLGTSALIFAAVTGAWYYASHLRDASTQQTYQTQEETDDVYVRFDMEAYDAIVANYWMKPGTFDLPQIFNLSAQKATGATTTLPSDDRAGTAAMLASAFKAATSTEAKMQYAINTLVVVLYNLPPNGRDQLLSTQQETALRQEVSNINPSTNLYSDLGVEKGASPEAVDTAYKAKVAVLAHNPTPEAKQELQKVTYAHQVLADTGSKALYDTSQIEPTVFRQILGSTLYVYIEKVSPTTLLEFARAVDAASTTPKISSMILDLRGNIGGALDFTAALMGLFIGQNQYAFDLYHQGDYQPQRTTKPKFPELARYREIAILTDGMTQSTAELTTASMKRAHLAYSVGSKTRGWGSVENTYPLKTVISTTTSYTLLLVNNLTLRDDQLPIEQNGVMPDVDTSAKNWQSQLGTYFNSPSLINALAKEATQPPIK